MPAPALRLRGPLRIDDTPHDVFHPILELELPLLNRGLFEVLGFGEVGLDRKVCESLLEFLVPGGQFPELIVGLEKHGAVVLHVDSHAFRLLVKGLSRSARVSL
jgi:hypothetical protein